MLPDATVLAVRVLGQRRKSGAIGGDCVTRGNAGQAPQLADSLTSGREEPGIRVLVRRDRMEALISVPTPPGGIPAVTVAQLLDSLKAAGVVYGIDEQVLEILTQIRTVDYTCCARGLPPSDGTDGFLRYHVDIESQGRPTLLEDGRVDFKNINNFISVEAGQLLVERVPPRPGEPGMDVIGLPVPAKPAKDVSLPVGKNAKVVDRCQLVAAIPGQLHIAHDRVNVLPVIEVKGDVDYSTGNIDFKGSVIIHGSVQAGFSVKAGGNAEIRGNISGGMVEANNITVRTGIQGMNRSVVKAYDRLVARFIENATVCAGKEVVVGDVILHSKVFAGIRIIVEGRRGLVLGGRLSAGEEIRVRSAGNRSQVATDLEVSVNPFLKEELFVLRSELLKAEASAEDMKRSLAYMRAQGIENLPTAKRERYDKMEAEYGALPERLEDMRLRVEDIDSVLYSLKPGNIHVANVLYPGVRVFIGPIMRIIGDPLKYLTLYVQEGEVRFTSFSGSRK